MSVVITVRDVPDAVRDELAGRAARAGKSLQEYLRGMLVESATRPQVDDVIARARTRVAATRFVSTPLRSSTHEMPTDGDGRRCLVTPRPSWPYCSTTVRTVAGRLGNCRYSLARTATGDVRVKQYRSQTRDGRRSSVPIRRCRPTVICSTCRSSSGRTSFSVRGCGELRSNLSGYDASYVAVAELANAPLITLDRRTTGLGLRCGEGSLTTSSD